MAFPSKTISFWIDYLITTHICTAIGIHHDSSGFTLANVLSLYVWENNLILSNSFAWFNFCCSNTPLNTNPLYYMPLNEILWFLFVVRNPLLAHKMDFTLVYFKKRSTIVYLNKSMIFMLPFSCFCSPSVAFWTAKCFTIYYFKKYRFLKKTY